MASNPCKRRRTDLNLNLGTVQTLGNRKNRPNIWGYGLFPEYTWLNDYYKTKCEFSGGGGGEMHLEKIDLIKFKMAAYRPLFTFQ